VPTISLCMIVKDEEAVIDRCLACVHHLVDEINIVDTGSTDRTKEICRRYTDRIFDFPWCDDFAAARNFSFAQATCDFIFWLDADDVLSEEDQRKFQELKDSLTPDVSAVSMEYQLSLGPDGKPSHSLRRYRLVNRRCGFRWIGAVHEYLEVGGNIIHSQVAVQHRPVAQDRDPDRNIRIYEAMLARGAEFTPRDLYYYANELLDHRRYVEAADYYQRFLATGKGWVEDVIGACNKLSECFKQLGDAERELESALRTLQYDAPRAEACCRIADVFFRREDYRTAVFWYQAAIASPTVKPDRVPMFENKAYSTWVPHMALCITYYRLGMYFLSYLHNEIAGKYLPNDERIARNRALLEPLAKKEREELQKKAEARFPQTIRVEEASPRVEPSPNAEEPPSDEVSPPAGQSPGS